LPLPQGNRIAPKFAELFPNDSRVSDHDVKKGTSEVQDESGCKGDVPSVRRTPFPDLPVRCDQKAAPMTKFTGSVSSMW
jgi:hypothetical protein